MDRMLRETGRSALRLPIPWPIAKAMGKLGQWLPGAPITHDQVLMLQADNIVSQQAIAKKLTIQGMGIKPATLASIFANLSVSVSTAGPIYPAQCVIQPIN